MSSESVERRTFSARLDCHYLLRPSAEVDESTLLVAALHGFGSNPEVMLRLTEGLLGPRPVIASVQAPSQFFLSQHASEVGYCWATQKHSDESVRLHHEMLLHVLDEAGRQYGIPPSRRLLVGFSQPVGMNYRFAATHPEAVRGVIGICGGVPKNWEDGPYRQVSAALLHIARSEDEFYPACGDGEVRRAFAVARKGCGVPHDGGRAPLSVEGRAAGGEMDRTGV